MRIVRASEYRRMPWKNGGGETYEIAVFPPEASLQDFGWRISMARVASDGPFSIFPGVDRTLSIVEGAGFHLAVEGFDPVELRPDTAPYLFSAGLAAHARLISGPIQALNVMTRRGRFDHAVQIMHVQESFDFNHQKDVGILISGGDFTLNNTNKINKNDAVILNCREKCVIESIDSINLISISISSSG
ncbi:HutD family protein [Devosia sp. YIM 151766]|uniref:HutD/Ves family protein n=1 Tax=Devosia sp. YIM 151766 TaxID=3017325 RepID=UPI00255C6FAB|nr:HutD family protein [Devosia sp. YIM 151766]WIY53879.1 HutD family protein [Devosia sp. YIM 151766]